MSAARVHRRARLTRDGLAVTTFAVALAIVAWVGAGAAVHLIVAGLVSLLLVEQVFGWWNLATLEVTRHAPVELFAEDVLPGEFVVRRRGRGAAWDLWIDDGVAPGARAHLAELPAGKDARARAVWSFARRGVVSLDVVTVRSSFPFGLMERTVTFLDPAEVWVWPRPRVGGATSVDATGSTARRTTEPEEIDDLRPYRPGDRLRDLHASTTARTGEPHVVVRRGHADAALWIDVPSGGGPSREVEIERAAGSVLQASEQRRPVGLRAEGRTWAPRTGAEWERKLLSILAELPS